MTYNSSQIFESYVPVYDAVPEKWEDARPFIVEQLKKVSNAINIREIGWYLDEELLSGKAFIPGVLNDQASQTSQNYRSILRKIVDVSPLAIGANIFPHGITFDANLTNIQFWVGATNSTTLIAYTFVSPEVTVDATNINITSPLAFDRAYFIFEYMQEL